MADSTKILRETAAAEAAIALKRPAHLGPVGDQAEGAVRAIRQVFGTVKPQKPLQRLR